MEKRDKIIVVGGGFAGLQFARKLNGKIEKKVMVIDKANHHMFQPLFYQVACGRIEPSNISFPFRKIFQRSKNIQFRMTDVKEIIPSEHKIITEDATFHYDKLVIATGCKTNFFGNQKMESCYQDFLLVHHIIILPALNITLLQWQHVVVVHLKVVLASL